VLDIVEDQELDYLDLLTPAYHLGERFRGFRGVFQSVDSVLVASFARYAFVTVSGEPDVYVGLVLYFYPLII
jgi:hypothetical protein